MSPPPVSAGTTRLQHGRRATIVVRPLAANGCGMWCVTGGHACGSVRLGRARSCPWSPHDVRAVIVLPPMCATSRGRAMWCPRSPPPPHSRAPLACASRWAGTLASGDEVEAAAEWGSLGWGCAARLVSKHRGVAAAPRRSPAARSGTCAAPPTVGGAGGLSRVGPSARFLRVGKSGARGRARRQ